MLVPSYYLVSIRFYYFLFTKTQVAVTKDVRQMDRQQNELRSDKHRAIPIPALFATILKVSLFICFILSPCKQEQRLQTCAPDQRTYYQVPEEESKKAIILLREQLAQQCLVLLWNIEDSTTWPWTQRTWELTGTNPDRGQHCLLQKIMTVHLLLMDNINVKLL